MEVVDSPGTRTRLAAYALVVDGDRILLTRVAAGYPGAGRWNLPGGGVEPDEQPVDGVLRELYEETGLHGSVAGLLDVSTRLLVEDRVPDHDLFHWIRVLYRVAAAGEPRVVEAGGSTADVAWVALDEVAHLQTIEVVDHALGWVGG